MSADPKDDPAPDIRLRAVLSWRKLSRGFRQSAHHYRNRPVLHSTQTELNREFGGLGQKSAAGWFFLTLLVLAAIDFLYLHTVPGGGF